MKVRLGPVWDDFQKSFEQPPPVSVRFNTKKLQPPDGDIIPWCPAGRYLVDRPSFTLDPLFHAGAYYVQEASSMLVEQAITQSVNLQEPLTVLDLCAAPGGKSTHSLNLLSNDSLLVSNEVIRSRVNVLIENIEKWGHDNAIVTNNDPADFGRVSDMFDLILVDAPCSGEGLFRKDPEAIHQWSPKQVELCSLRQRRIVTDVWPALKPGGILIYTTCTYNKVENEENLDWLSAQAEMEFVPLKVDARWGVEIIEKGRCIGYQCFPHRLKGEGFFLSVIQKVGANSSRSSKTKYNLKYPTNLDTEQLKPWIDAADTQCFFLHGRQVRMIPVSLKNDLMIALQSLHVIAAGTAVGEVIKNKMIPEHALALSLKLQTQALPKINVDLNEALAYLRKNPIHAPDGNGFHQVEFMGIGLGWVNALPNRVNNMYPGARRIRL